MKHSIIFNNADNHWDNALPLGNGCFGSMVYFEGNSLYVPMNHYEVYYNIAENVLPSDVLAATPDEKEPGLIHIQRKEMADGNQPPDGEPYALYRSPRKTAENLDACCSNLLASYPQTGNLKFNISETMKGADSSLALYIEDATTQFTLKNKEDEVKFDTIVARDDVMINHVFISDEKLMPSFEISITPSRGSDYYGVECEHPSVTYSKVDEKTFVYTAVHQFGEKTFSFSGVIRLCGAEGSIKEIENGAEITLAHPEKEFYILTGVFTDFRCKNPAQDGICAMDKYENSIQLLYSEHKKYWDGFFARSAISIPDKFLEHVYYINQYALDCCSGKDGVMRHHACGLNGLWAIRHPNLWGSMWYWDVNIQAAFAGVFSSNRLDLAKVFSDGLRSYMELAKKSAHNEHNAHGIAGDYPYSFYYSCWPWCAQYLWHLYEYSLDEDYLRNDAFPLFVGLCEFFCDIFKYDSERGYYSVYPDVSPEQGPLTHDSVITVACVKYLFKFTLEAAEILKTELPVLEECREIMNNMAPYPISEEGMYGIHFRDSHDAPDNMWIRHPSMLMPLFPIAEYDERSDKEILKILSNTVDFLDERCEIGIFGGSWIAASAARLGRGQTAIRILYERGIDHMLRSNGLTAEETERFINYCLVPRQPLYYPCMMEFTGEMLAAVNEMLLQSHNGLIRVFPALPDGGKEYERALRHGYSLADCADRFANYDAWKTLRIDKLLCKGAFEVTASITDGILDFIQVHSIKGSSAHITSPYMEKEAKVFCDGTAVNFEHKDGVISFETEAGKTYLIARNADICTDSKENDTYHNEVLSRTTYTRRNIYLGENPETKYQKAIDGFIRDWYMGNVRMQNHTVYKFDFTNDNKKKYRDCMYRQYAGAEESVIRMMGFFCLGDNNLAFTPQQGYGFRDASDIKIVCTDVGDALRRDAAMGDKEAEFVIEAPRGQYELMVVSGSECEDTITILDGVNGMSGGGDIVRKGQYQCKLIPIINEKDVPIRLRVSTTEGYRWSVNYIMLNAIKGY